MAQPFQQHRSRLHIGRPDRSVPGETILDTSLDSVEQGCIRTSASLGQSFWPMQGRIRSWIELIRDEEQLGERLAIWLRHRV